MPELCKEIDEIRFSSKGVRIEKKEGENGLGAFLRWMKGQANGWCQSGLCSSGECVGHWKNTRLRILKETDDYVKLRFSVVIFCSCDGGEEETGSSETPSSSSGTSGASSADAGDCACTRAQENAELQQMLQHYATAVNNARATGYQAANDPGYSDPGLGFHKVGNCADWQKVSWGALVVRRWRCWDITQIRARQEWTLLTFHHFVKIRAICSGRVFYLDPWGSGNPDHWPGSSFPFPDGNGWAHTETLTHSAGSAPRDPVDD